MTINVKPSNPTPTAKASKKVPFVFFDKSGAHTILTLVIPGLVPISQQFGLSEGMVQTFIELDKGLYDCSLAVQAVAAHENGTINRSYDCGLKIDGKLVFAAKGSIAKTEPSDIGFDTVELSII